MGKTWWETTCAAKQTGKRFCKLFKALQIFSVNNCCNDLMLGEHKVSAQQKTRKGPQSLSSNTWSWSGYYFKVLDYLAVNNCSKSHEKVVSILAPSKLLGKEQTILTTYEKI